MCESRPELHALWGSLGLIHTTSVRRRICLCMGRSRNALWVRPSVHSPPWPASKKLRNIKLFRRPRIRRPIRSHSTRLLDPFCNNKQEKSGRYIFLRKCGMIGLFLVSCLCHLLVFISTHPVVAGSDLFGCSMRLRRLVPYRADAPSVIRRRTHVVRARRCGSLRTTMVMKVSCPPRC